eukprot:Skav213488  [mRNA]  locus=scaffold3849:57469:57834:+ [translate_table: standard]
MAKQVFNHTARLAPAKNLEQPGDLPRALAATSGSTRAQPFRPGTANLAAAWSPLKYATRVVLSIPAIKPACLDVVLQRDNWQHLRVQVGALLLDPVAQPGPGRPPWAKLPASGCLPEGNQC